MVLADSLGLPPDYDSLLEEIKHNIHTARTKAALSLNRSLITLYWDIGKVIVERQRKEGWGKSIVEKLSADIQTAFPGMSGFSPLNIRRMRAFYLAWTEDVKELSQPVTEIDIKKLSQLVTEIPWGHNIALIQKVKNPVERIWYARQILEHGWSRSVLIHHMESRLYERQGSAITNFDATLPVPQAGLATQMIRDPFNFGFLSLAEDVKEKELERGLLGQIRNFLLELGTGFAFVGQQVHIQVDSEDFYIDLLFYHLRLRCYVVIDLKAVDFKPEFAGKMNFYLSAVDEILRHLEDRPSIGIIICKTRSRMIAEYSLRDLRKPMGVARYVTGSLESLPKDYRELLPTQEELEEGLGRRTDSEEEG